MSIQIAKDQTGYDAIQQFVAAKTAHIRDLRDVEGRCIYDDDDNDDMQGPSPPPKLHLYPCKLLLMHCIHVYTNMCYYYSG